MSQDLDRVYTIPLGKVLLSPDNQRAKRAINMIKEFARRHMKIDDVRIDEEVAQLVWARGMRRPPRKIRVRMERTEEKHILITRYDERDDAAGAPPGEGAAAGAGTEAAAAGGAAIAAAGAPALESAEATDAGADRLDAETAVAETAVAETAVAETAVAETAVAETAVAKETNNLADKDVDGPAMSKESGVDAGGPVPDDAGDDKADVAPAPAGKSDADEGAAGTETEANGAGSEGGSDGAASPDSAGDAADDDGDTKSGS